VRTWNPRQRRFRRGRGKAPQPQCHRGQCALKLSAGQPTDVPTNIARLLGRDRSAVLVCPRRISADELFRGEWVFFDHLPPTILLAARHQIPSCACCPRGPLRPPPSNELSGRARGGFSAQFRRDARTHLRKRLHVTSSDLVDLEERLVAMVSERFSRFSVRRNSERRRHMAASWRCWERAPPDSARRDTSDSTTLFGDVLIFVDHTIGAVLANKRLCPPDPADRRSVLWAEIDSRYGAA
jgi:hypothetical protein